MPTSPYEPSDRVERYTGKLPHDLRNFGKGLRLNIELFAVCKRRTLFDSYQGTPKTRMSLSPGQRYGVLRAC